VTENEELALEVEELNAALELAQHERDDLRGRFQQHVYASAVQVARDLVSLLNRARDLGIAVCPDVDDREGTSYSIEWAFDGARWDLDVEWRPGSAEWTCIASRSDSEAGA
jgi:hypothetical protein